jgi:hypothetical protein
MNERFSLLSYSLALDPPDSSGALPTHPTLANEASPFSLHSSEKSLS